MDYANYLQELIHQPWGSVKWYGTRRDLIELVSTVAYRKIIKNRRGVPVSQRKLTRSAFAAVGLKPPRHVEAEVWKIRNRLTQLAPLSQRITAPQA